MAKQPARKLLLASSSPRRVMLLNHIGMTFSQCAPDVDESQQGGELPSDYVQRVARNKAAAVGVEVKNRATVVILAADTAVVLEGNILGKPRSREHGIEMLRALSGREHFVMTGVTIQGESGSNSFYVETRVSFRHLHMDEIRRYGDRNAPEMLEMAGGYGIQGVGAVFVASIKGSYSNVVGLPIPETLAALAPFGIHCISQGSAG